MAIPGACIDVRRALASMIALASATTGLTVTAADAQEGRAPASCGTATRLVPESPRRPGATPVVLVHGFQGSPRDFSKTVDDGRTLRSALSREPGVALYTFDYRRASKQWVENEAIGPALARDIVCLREQSGRRVVVVAHSMGGLAARFAQGQVIDGQPVSDSLAQVITIGTPNRGVILLSIADGDISNILVRAATEAADATCDDPPEHDSDLCELLRAANIPAVKAMAPDSPFLAGLPHWDPRLAVDGVAADLRLRVSALGIGTTVSLGDIVVNVESATADATPSSNTFVARCPAELTDLVDVVDKSHCSHANELSNHRIVRHVVEKVREVRRAA